MAKKRVKKEEVVVEAEQATVNAEEQAEKEAEEQAQAAKQAEDDTRDAEEQAKKEAEEVAAKQAAEEQAKKEASTKQVSKTKKTFEDLYNEKKDDTVIGPVAEALKYYVDVCYKQSHSDGPTIASMNYNLFNTIIGALNTEDKQASKAKMDFINRAFLVEKDRYFNIISLNRYDHFWSYGNETKMGYVMLVKYISEMANPNTRKQKAKIVIAEKMAKFLPEGIIGKLETYYKV